MLRLVYESTEIQLNFSQKHVMQYSCVCCSIKFLISHLSFKFLLFEQIIMHVILFQAKWLVVFVVHVIPRLSVKFFSLLVVFFFFVIFPLLK